jgi:hypothetical protein
MVNSEDKVVLMMQPRLESRVSDLFPTGRMTVFYDTKNERYVYLRVKRLGYGDALICFDHGGWRLEYIAPDSGFVNYRLYAGSRLVGIQYVRAASWLPVVQHYVAAYLTILGFTPYNTELKIDGAKTRVSAETNRLPKLFEIPDELLFEVTDEDD